MGDMFRFVNRVGSADGGNEIHMFLIVRVELRLARVCSSLLVFPDDLPRRIGNSVLAIRVALSPHHILGDFISAAVNLAAHAFQACSVLVSELHGEETELVACHAPGARGAGALRVGGDFVRDRGRGVLKRLIVDRGFIDGEKDGHCKRDLGIEVLIPARTDMDIYQDVVGLAEGGLLTFQAVPAVARAVPSLTRRRQKETVSSLSPLLPWIGVIENVLSANGCALDQPDRPRAPTPLFVSVLSELQILQYSYNSAAILLDTMTRACLVCTRAGSVL